jgi:hypothetical protein
VTLETLSFLAARAALVCERLRTASKSRSNYNLAEADDFWKTIDFFPARVLIETETSQVFGGLPVFGQGETVSEQDLELQCLFALRGARAAFFNDIVEHSRAHGIASNGKISLSKEDVDVLRSEEAFQVAEFYYTAEKANLNDRETIRLFLQRHNDDLRADMNNKEKLETLGLTRERLKDGLFSDQAIEKVSQFSDGKLRLDQSDLGRLLSPLMSPETTRKAVVALDKGGLLTRVKIGPVLIASTGTLERYFEKHLHRIVRTLKDALLNGRMPS